MDAVKFLKERNRMCNSFEICSACPLHRMCSPYIKFDEETAVSTVEKWSKEHPIKTRMTEFLKQYPNAPICKDDGFPKCLPCTLNNEFYARKCEGNCDKCRKKYWTEEIE